jgi:anti-sigma factor RsiW
MTCDQAETLLFESIDTEPALRAADGSARALRSHLASCEGCAALAAQLSAVDARLSAALPPVFAPASLAEGVRRQVRRERLSALRESLPDFIHLAGCAIATVLSAALLPVDPPVTLAAGLTVTCFTYVVMAIVRSSLEAVDQPDW